jgi:hypothetical protein
MPEIEPTISFFRLIPAAPEPRRADRAAGGHVPLRALRFCDPLTSAAAFGWWVFPPMGFSLMWDGGPGVLWTYDNDDTWYPLRTTQFPDFAEYFASIAPEAVKPYSPPFMLTSIEPGIIQIWTGWIARTRPGWSSLIRQPANFPRTQGLDYLEGIIETDSWFGPLFINVRLNKTDVPIMIRPDQPLLQVTPIYREHYSNSLLDDVRVVMEPGSWTDREWEAFHRTVVIPQTTDRPHGAHAAEVRRRRKLDARGQS